MKVAGKLSGVSLGAKHGPRHPQGNLGDQRGTAPLGPSGSHQGLLITASTRHSLLSCSSLDVEPGVGVGRSPRTAPERGVSSWTLGM